MARRSTYRTKQRNAAILDKVCGVALGTLGVLIALSPILFHVMFE